jgi:hypothetical protein
LRMRETDGWKEWCLLAKRSCVWFLQLIM